MTDGAPTTSSELRAEIERTRVQLGDTVNALSDRVNVKARTSSAITAHRPQIVAAAAAIAIVLAGTTTWRRRRPS